MFVTWVAAFLSFVWISDVGACGVLMCCIIVGVTVVVCVFVFCGCYCNVFRLV